MITFKTKDFDYVGTADRVAGECLSTDTKPTTGVANGSTLLEMDTSKVYAFNEAGAEWLEISCCGGGGGGGGDAGYECTETRTTLTEESVTTESSPVGNRGGLSYEDPITANTIKVTLDGNEYTLNATISEAPGGFTYQYGGEGYTFTLVSNDAGIVPLGGRNSLITETAGTYSIKIEAVEETVETTPCFEKAVKAVVPEAPVMRLIPDTTTKQDIEAAYSEGKLMYWLDPTGTGYYIVKRPDTSAPFAFSKFPENSGLAIGLDSNLELFSWHENAG